MNRVPVSFEFFPPADEEALKKLLQVRERLAAAAPGFYSVTYGAGGSTRDRTFRTVEAMIDAGVDAAPHLSFGSDDDDTIAALLDRYVAMGVKRFVALRGDAVSGTGSRPRYAAELVRFIRARHGDAVAIEVACYPEFHPNSTSPSMDVAHFREKVEAGADAAITQYFYNADAYFHYVDLCRASGIEVPIVPGVMPITNVDNLIRFSDRAGAEIPRWMLHRLNELKEDKPALLAFGVEQVTRLCEALIEGGAPGLHLYSMNQSKAALAILDGLGLVE